MARWRLAAPPLAASAKACFSKTASLSERCFASESSMISWRVKPARAASVVKATGEPGFVGGFPVAVTTSQ